MPIRPENKKLYPKNWPEIREKIKVRAGNKCEICGVENHADGIRDSDGVFHKWGSAAFSNLAETKKRITIVCTVMHLDHAPENCADHNLKFGCQRCHNRYDSAHRAENRRKRKIENQLQIEFKE